MVLPKIVAHGPDAGVEEITRTFRFEGKRHRLRFQVDSAVYEGAKTADKFVKIRNDLKGYDWSDDYQGALINDAAQEPFYNTLLEGLRHIRDLEDLDSDRYAELISIFVQSIPYCTEPNQDPKFPVEAFVDNCGDCDDMGRLLAALLSREGFDVVLFIFHEEEHMATGIRMAARTAPMTRIP